MGAGTRNALRRALLCLLMATFTFGTMALAPSTARAQQEEQPEKKPAAPDGEVKEKTLDNPIVHFFVSIGIVFGIVFAAISVGTLALIIILAMDLRMGEAVNSVFVDDFTGLVNKRQFKQAFEMCKNDTSFLARVMSSGMGRLQYGIEDAREAMKDMVETVRAGKESLITYLATVGTLGPLLGLVGTVSGMIGAFRKLGAGDQAPKPSELAGEISHALVVTLVGVAIAVPAIFFYSFFKNRLTAIANNTSNLADDLLTQMYHNSKKGAGAPAPVPTAAGDRAATAVQEKK